MNGRKHIRQQPVARHGKPDSRLSELEDQDGGHHADKRAQQHGKPNIVEAMSPWQQAHAFKSIDDRRAVARDALPRHHSCERCSDTDIEHCADDERRDDTDRNVAARIPAFLTGR